jgi:hypothetical protein
LKAEPELLERVTAAARRSGVSVNDFILSAIESKLQFERDQEWREGFEAMGRDSDVSDVEYLMPAAWEVVLGD